MLKIFLHLYFFIALTFVIFFLGVTYLPDYLLKNTISDTISNTAGGMFYLLEDELNKHQQAEWPQKVVELQSRYSYPLNIADMSDYKFDSTEVGYLNNKKTVYREVDGADIWYHRIQNTPYVIAMAMANTNTRKEELSAKGTFSLAMDKYSSQPEERWQELTDEVQKQFGIPVQIVQLQALSVSGETRDRLNKGELVGVDIYQQTERYIQRIGKSKWFLQAGPITDPVILTLLDYIIFTFLALMIALAVWLWLRPMWSGLVNLDRTATAFGAGDFEVRAEEHKTSPTHQLATTFNAMAQRIKSLIKTQKDLTNAVAHELRTPLSRIRFATEMLGQCDDSDKGRHLKGINRDIDEMGELVDELLLYAKFDQNGQKIDKKKQSLNRWLNQFNFEPCHGDSFVSPVLKVDNNGEEDSLVVFDETYLERALNNLLSNACRYAKSKIEITSEYNHENLVIHVDDDGPGIPAESYGRIFEPFYRLDPSRDKSTGGYGLGLAIVKQIMIWHKGAVLISTSPLGGARFSLYLPKREK